GRSWQVISLPAMAGQASLVTADVPASDGGTLYIAGPGIGVQRSVDEGRTWQPLSSGLPSQDVIAFTIHRNQPETLYAAVAGEGIYQSEDAGQNWQKMDGGPAQPIRRLVHSDMEGSMQTGWLYAVSDDAVRLSMDCFCGWRPGGELGDGQVYDVAYNSEAPKQVFVTTQQGLLHSDNGGRTWQPVPADAAHDAKVAIALTPTGALYALEADGEVRVSMDQGDTWTAPDA
ncbi:MAG: hypothetical protein UMU75_06615, partial [Halomonas sp.]|nr:hypothetical protein [Halomonas sp.]